MKEEQDYIQDLTRIRSMMERSSKFLSLSGWAGILAGIYAIAGAFIAWKVFGFHPDQLSAGLQTEETSSLWNVGLLAAGILILAIATALFDSRRKAEMKGEKAWNAASKRLLVNMAVPLVSGGILLLILMAKGLIALAAPLTLLFYGLALFNAAKFTYDEIKIVGIIQIALGLLACLLIQYSLIFWTIGFGLVHIVYGIYMHVKYKR